MFDELLKQLREYDAREKATRQDHFRVDPDADAAHSADFTWLQGEKADKVDERNMVVSCTISTKGRDRSRDVMNLDGMNVENHKKNPIVLFDHYRSRPCGTAATPTGAYTVKRSGDLMVAETHFFKGDEYADEVFKMVAQKALNGCSVGFRSSYADVKRTPDDPNDPYGPATYHIQKSELLEYSHVVIPDNPDCLVNYVKGLKSGRPVHDAILKRLEPTVAPLMTQRFFRSGWEQEKKDDPKPPPGAVTKTVVKRVAMRVAPTYAGPAGAQAIAKGHDLLTAAAVTFRKGFLETEGPGQRTLLAKAANDLTSVCRGLADFYGREYPTLKALAPDQDPTAALAANLDLGLPEAQAEVFKALGERVKAVADDGPAPDGWVGTSRLAVSALREAVKALGPDDDRGPDLDAVADRLEKSLYAQAPAGDDPLKAKEAELVEARKKLEEATKAQQAMTAQLDRLMRGQKDVTYGPEAERIAGPAGQAAWAPPSMY